MQRDADAAQAGGFLAGDLALGGGAKAVDRAVMGGEELHHENSFLQIARVEGVDFGDQGGLAAELVVRVGGIRWPEDGGEQAVGDVRRRSGIERGKVAVSSLR